jgi:hypothetical protein
VGNYTGDEGSFQLLSLDTSTLTGTFTGSFVFVAANGDRLVTSYGADPSHPGVFTLAPTADGKFIATFVAVFTPVPGQSTGRFADVTGGSWVMIATTEPFSLQGPTPGFSAPFNYTWHGEGTLVFGKDKP